MRHATLIDHQSGQTSYTRDGTDDCATAERWSAEITSEVDDD
ncbi:MULTISPECIES: hypothetical protein [unclassified Halorhabdus]|nr:MULTISPECIES: hypothetical protein [unclassified Halorhabdus]